MNLIKLQMCHSKCSPDTYGSISARAPQRHKLLHRGIKSVLVNLLQSSAATAVNLSEHTSAHYLQSHSLATCTEKSGTEARNGLGAPQPG